MVTLDERVSRLEGIIEQVNERLGNLERGQDALRQEMRQLEQSLRQEMREGQESLRQEMRTQFHWMMGTFLGVAIAILGAVMAALLTR